MEKILVIGATGNVGQEVVKALKARRQQVVSAVTKKDDLRHFDPGSAVVFDFTDSSNWEQVLAGIDKVFLMRPPAIADVKTFLFPFIDAVLENGCKQIAFLSLQGVQFNPLTPHFKVERYLRKKKAPYTFLRPNFFMQNLSTFYREDIAKRDEIFLPAGKGRTAFVDVRDLGAAAATVLTESGHIGKAYTLSGSESLDYYEVAQMIGDELSRKISYKNPSARAYEDRLRSQKVNDDFIKVQKMLYFVVRHNFSASTTSDIVKLLGCQPASFAQFVKDYADVWSSK